MARSKIRLGGISDKTIYYREMPVMQSMPLKQEPFRFMYSGYRRWCKPWWGETFAAINRRLEDLRRL